MKLRSLLAGLCLLWAGSAQAASVAIGYPCNQYQLPSTCADFQNLMLAINAIITPLIPNINGTAVNTIELLPAVTGGIPIISPSTVPPADANAPIGLAGNGTGNVILFAGVSPTWNAAGPAPNPNLLQIAGTTAFIKANGLSPCPGMAINRPPMLGNMSGVVTGFFVVADWLGYEYGVPVCGPTVSGTVARGG